MEGVVVCKNEELKLKLQKLVDSLAEERNALYKKTYIKGVLDGSGSESMAITRKFITGLDKLKVEYGDELDGAMVMWSDE